MMDKIKEVLYVDLFHYASALAYEDIEEGRTPIDSYQEFIEELELTFREELIKVFENYKEKIEIYSKEYDLGGK